MQKRIPVLIILVGLSVGLLVMLKDRGNDQQLTEDGSIQSTDLVKIEVEQDVSHPELSDSAQSTQLRDNNLEKKSSALIHEVDASLLDSSILEQFLSKRLVASYRVVTVDTDSLREFLRGDTSVSSPQIDLVDGYSVSVKTIEAQEHSSGWQNGMATWVGKVIGDDAGGVTVVVTPNGGLDGTVTSSKGRFRIEESGQSPYHVVWRMDEHEPYPID